MLVSSSYHALAAVPTGKNAYSQSLVWMFWRRENVFHVVVFERRAIHPVSRPPTKVICGQSNTYCFEPSPHAVVPSPPLKISSFLVPYQNGFHIHCIACYQCRITVFAFRFYIQCTLTSFYRPSHENTCFPVTYLSHVCIIASSLVCPCE